MQLKPHNTRHSPRQQCPNINSVDVPKPCIHQWNENRWLCKELYSAWPCSRTHKNDRSGCSCSPPLLPMWSRPSQPGVASIHVRSPLFSILMWANGPTIVSSWHRWSPTGFWKGSAQPEGSQEGSFWCHAFAFNTFQDCGLPCPCSLAETNVRWFKRNFGK